MTLSDQVQILLSLVHFCHAPKLVSPTYVVNAENERERSHVGDNIVSGYHM